MAEQLPELPVGSSEAKDEAVPVSRRRLLTIGVPLAAGVVVPLITCGATPVWQKFLDQFWPAEKDSGGFEGDGRRPASPGARTPETSPAPTATPSPKGSAISRPLEPIPVGGSQYVCIGVPVEVWQATFDRVNGADYELYFFDGYEVGGKAYVNAIFRPWDGVPWTSGSNMTGMDFDMKHNELKNTGYRLIHVKSYLRDGQLRYSGMWRKERGPQQVLYRGLSQSAYQARVDALTPDGYRPVAVTVATPNGSPQWTGLYEKKSMRGAWQAESWLTSAEYGEEWDKAAARRMYPIYLSTTQYQGQTRISAIWDTDPGWVESRYDLTAEQLAAKVAANYQSGYKLLAVAGYEATAGSARYAATWSR